MKNTFIPHEGNDHTPHILSKRSLWATLALALFLQLSVLASTLLLPKVSEQFVAVLPSVVTLLTNSARADSSLPELKTNTLLVQAAQAKASDMAEKGYFAHQSPDGSQPWDWIARAGFRYEYAGENLAVNYTDSEEVVRAWQNSPTHNMNLLGPRYTEVGVAMARGVYKGQEAVFVVQMFASPAVTVAHTDPLPAKTEPRPVSQPSSPAQESSGQEEVLATEVGAPAPILGAEVERSTAPSLWSQVLSSPRTYVVYPLLAVALLFFFSLIVGWGRHHPRALANGAVAVAVLAGFMFINKNVLFPALELPQDAEYSATAFQALE